MAVGQLNVPVASHPANAELIVNRANQLSARGLRKSYFKGTRREDRGVISRAGNAVGRLATWRKKYGGIEVPVLLGVDLDVQPGEFVSVAGTSGSGKSTLLHVLGTLDKPDAGQILLDGERIDHLHTRERDRVRNEIFGFIFQFYHLLPELNALENVLTPLMIRHGVVKFWSCQKRLRRDAEALLERVGLADRRRHKPSELSGGEMQRTAIARAFAGHPKILLADEPTGNLDANTGQDIFDLLVSLNREEGLTIIMVTHNRGLAERTDRCLKLVEGRIEPLE